jgi:hypothetical protein
MISSGSGADVIRTELRRAATQSQASFSESWCNPLELHPGQDGGGEQRRECLKQKPQVIMVW